jgi:acetyl esterase/lipase
MAEERAMLHVPERAIPVPKHVSAEAQALLAHTFPFDLPPLPGPEDTEAWRAVIAASDVMLAATVAWQLKGVEAEVRELREGEALAYDVLPAGVSASDPRVILDIHGGAFVMGAGEVCRDMAIGLAGRLGRRVIAVDYRMPPDHPYPAGLDDCVAIYRALLRDRRPEDIIVEGLSAGGGIAPAMILRARDEGLPLPAAAVILSPACDMTKSGDSFHANWGIDPGLSRDLMPMTRLYAGGADLSHPYLSPLFGDFTKGFPPTFLLSGTRDLLLSNTVRLHRALRAAGVPAELHIVEAAHHGSMGAALPELAEIDREIRTFCAARWGEA